MEIHYIKLFKSFGAKLVNGTVGGIGVRGAKPDPIRRAKVGEANSRKVYYFDFESSKLLGGFDSIKKMIQELKLGSTMTAKVLSGRKRQHRGYTFSYNEICPIKRDKQYRSWNKGTSTKNLYKHYCIKIGVEKDDESFEFESIREAAKYLGVSTAYVNTCSKNGKLINGYKINRLQ